jgi:hypothetical protein
LRERKQWNILNWQLARASNPQEAGTEAKLERLAGLPTGTVSHYSCRNPNEPLRTTLVALAKGANVQLEWLCTGQGPKRRPAQLDLIPCCGINDL